MREIASAVMIVAVFAGLGCREEVQAAAPPPPAEVEEASLADAGPAAAPSMTETSADDGPFRELSWTAVSQDGTAVLMQTPTGNGKCRRTCNDAPGGAEVWSADGCIGKRIDLRFVGNDCRKVVVLHQLPEVSSGTRWQQVEVAHVYAQQKLAYPVAAAGAVRDFKKIRSAGNTFYWLQGALGQPGRAPRYAADGSAVEFVTVDGKAHTIPLVEQP